MTKTPTKFTIKDFQEFQKRFPSDEACLLYIFKVRYKGSNTCRLCKRGKLYQISGRRCYACSLCGKHVSPLSGTIYEKSSTSLTLWLYAIFLIAQSKSELSAKDLERGLGVTYKTAWRMKKSILDNTSSKYKKVPNDFMKIVTLTSTPCKRDEFKSDRE